MLYKALKWQIIVLTLLVIAIAITIGINVFSK